MTSRSSPPQDCAAETVEQFVYRFGESHRLLACHVALPLLLTPELVNYLRTYFLYGQVPWEAEVDILLSGFCRPVGYEQYVMDAEVRAYLLRQMEGDPHLGMARMQEVASLLIKYVQYLYRTHPQKRSHELQAQQWAAMVFLEDQREQAVRQIAEAFQQSAQLEMQEQGRSLVNEAEMARLAKLTKELAPQLERYPELIRYAEVVSQLFRQPRRSRQLNVTPQNYRVQDVALPDLTQLVPEPLTLRPGIAVKNVRGGGGTLGCFVRKRGQFQIYLLSACHVIVPPEVAQVGDSIISPETLTVDATAGEVIGTLAEYVQPNSGVANSVDVAIASVLDNIPIEPADVPGIGLGRLRGAYTSAASGLIGKRVRKIGAGSGITSGVVRSIGVRTNLAYPPGGSTYENLIEITSTGDSPFIQPGDSGALVVDDEGYAIGILIAGNETTDPNQISIALAIPIQTELDALDLELVLDINPLFKATEDEVRFPPLQTLEFETGQLVEESASLGTDAPNFPPLQTETFDIVTVEIDEPEYSSTVNLTPFSFETATLEWAPTLRRRWQIRREENHAEHYIEQLSDNVALDMVAIPGGIFLMGSPEDEPESSGNEEPQHEVTVLPFLMSRYPITQAQWKAVANLPVVARNLDPDPSQVKGENHPVEQVSWYDAIEFCQRLAAHSGLTYRLPSEAEWEYACRGGTSTPFHFGETMTTDLANFDGRYPYNNGPRGEMRGETTPIGHFGIANHFGLCDMHGNVYEWCADTWHINYVGAPKDGSAWLEKSDQTRRVRRGGSWKNHPKTCRSASRKDALPESTQNHIGFRVACSSPSELSFP